MLFATAASVLLVAQTREGAWNERTPWGDPDMQGEWTSEGEYSVHSNGRRSLARDRC